jgi:hypothetical protein
MNEVGLRAGEVRHVNKQGEESALTANRNSTTPDRIYVLRMENLVEEISLGIDRR